MSFSIADAIFWLAVACCSVAQLAIIRSVIISPARVAETAESASTGRRVVEIMWAVLPGIALVALFVFTWRAMHSASLDAGIVASMTR